MGNGQKKWEVGKEGKDKMKETDIKKEKDNMVNSGGKTETKTKLKFIKSHQVKPKEA